jgi:hypothetical protein
MDSLLAARAADEGEKTGPQPVAWRWKHQRDERWTYGQQPKHLVPPRGKELIGYYIVEPLFAEPPTPEWTLREQLGRVCEERDALLALLRDTVPQLTEIVRMTNAEFVADAHNAALSRLRAAAAERRK